MPLASATRSVARGMRRVPRQRRGRRSTGTAAGVEVACGFADRSATRVVSSGGMVLAYHLVWVAYGWWLPNDPRGSMSSAIASDVIADLGDIHYGRKKL